MGKKKFLRQIASFRELIIEHEKKILTEQLKSFPDRGLIEYWSKEVQTYKSELMKAERRLRR